MCIVLQVGVDECNDFGNIMTSNEVEEKFAVVATTTAPVQYFGSCTNKPPCMDDDSSLMHTSSKVIDFS